MPKTKSIGRPLRVLYLGGPGDAPAALRRKAAGDSFDDVAHVPYSLQFFDVCEELDAQVLSVSTHPRTDEFTFGKARAVNRTSHLAGKHGARYHLGHLSFAWEVARDTWNEKADVVVTATEPYPFLLEPLALRGVKVVPALHATLLPEFKEPSRGAKVLTRASRHLFERSCAAILSHPGPCAKQAYELTRGQPQPIVEFLPLFRRERFAQVRPPKRNDGPFRVITVGRLEPEKGIYDLIAVAKQLKANGRADIFFDVCGAGSALDDARNKVRELGLGHVMELHGWTKMDQLLELWNQSHAAVVPTTTDFVEGFNQVVIEALLAGRPVITSRVCPALDYARPSAIEVPENNVAAYCEAIVRLVDDHALYDRLQGNCARLASLFLEEDRSFAAAVRHVLVALKDGREVTPVSHPPLT
jgi:glycogen(starch) synthase